MRNNTTGIVWYERSQYRALAAHMTDAAIFPAVFDAWLAPARALYAAFEQDGRRVVRVYLDAPHFFEWCAQLGLAPSAVARRSFVQWFLSGCKTVAGNGRPVAEIANNIAGGGAWTWSSSPPPLAVNEVNPVGHWPGAIRSLRELRPLLRR